ncbi:phosphate-repressible phosphate permease [Apiosordaria backusii]|uniref:Phosphate transporter n=1 Tax=Apiosordaria backusii TaxID=314023 RepID=A0AA40BLC3_9PEZI|nr:phosphate-repressible phosphate permease [Apiosordaria backusii]
MPLTEFNYLFVTGTLFAFLDAWNIGANDVANAWATSVASRSIAYLPAMVTAAVMEFSGAVGVGARVADTIRTKIVDTQQFTSSPAVLMLGMVCAVVASSIYLSFATKVGLPVSTTHSLMGGVIGFGVAALGTQGIQWVNQQGVGVEKINSGVVQVFMAWIIAPVLAGVFASAIFLVTKYAVLLRKNPVMNGLFLVPVYFGITASLVVMLLVWKGGSYEVNLTDEQVPIVVVCVGIAFSLLVGVLFVPWLYRVLVKEDWQLRWYHIFQGPLVLRRGEVPPAPGSYRGPVRDYYEGHRAPSEAASQGDLESRASNDNAEDLAREKELEAVPERRRSLVGAKPAGVWYSRERFWYYIKWVLFHGVDQDVVGHQPGGTEGSRLEEMHARAAKYDNRAEHLYSFLQIMTAATASFTHGANDVSNAIGPYATIFQIWRDGRLPINDEADVPIWILVFGGAGIVLGLWTYGYNIMRNLGNKITLHSPSRGFSMELGSAFTIIMATRLALPVSTTQCITGATVGVGLCNGDLKTINWRMVAWIYGGWFITLPATALISGCLMGFVLNAPRWLSADLLS